MTRHRWVRWLGDGSHCGHAGGIVSTVHPLDWLSASVAADDRGRMVGHAGEERLSSLTTTDLVHGAAAGDRDAWETLVERYGRLVWSIVRGHRLSSADAADVVQTVWLRLVEHLDQLREPEHLGGWLTSTSRHECLRVLRRGAREVPDEGVELRQEAASRVPEQGGDPEERLLRSERQASLVAAFQRLPERCQVLLRMLSADPSPSYADVSAALEIPVGSIGPTRARCLDKLRTHLMTSPAAGVTP